MFLIFRAVGGIGPVQILRDTCTRFGCYLYSTKLSLKIKDVFLSVIDTLIFRKRKGFKFYTEFLLVIIVHEYRYKIIMLSIGHRPMVV